MLYWSRLHIGRSMATAPQSGPIHPGARLGAHGVGFLRSLAPKQPCGGQLALLPRLAPEPLRRFWDGEFLLS